MRLNKQSLQLVSSVAGQPADHRGTVMTLWKIERGLDRKFVLPDPVHWLDVVALIAIVASPGVALMMFVPLPLVLPILSIVSFLIACGVALFACSNANSRQPSIAHWEFVWAFAAVWVVAGTMSNPMTLIEWLDRLATS